MVAQEPQAEGQIDILHIAEEAIIEPARLVECIGADETGCGAGRKNLAFGWKVR